MNLTKVTCVGEVEVEGEEQRILGGKKHNKSKFSREPIDIFND